MLKSKTQDTRYNTQDYRLEIIILFFVLLLGVAYWLLSDTSFAQGRYIYDAKGKRDPFIPLVTPDGRLLKLDQEEGANALLLEGIIYDSYGLSYAIVNGGVVKVGDVVNDYQVLKIEKNKLIFIKDGQPQEVELKKEEE